jgi:hypothetical protein
MHFVAKVRKLVAKLACNNAATADGGVADYSNFKIFDFRFMIKKSH